VLSRYHSVVMDDRTFIEQVARAIGAAIEAKDMRALEVHLTPDFVLRRPGGEPVPRAAFIASVGEQPVQILSVVLEQIEIDAEVDSAIATGVQTSQVRIDGELVHDRQPFVDWFVKREGRWQLRAAMEFSDW
jgi:ketosteroid isomerase-like protein